LGFRILARGSYQGDFEQVVLLDLCQELCLGGGDPEGGWTEAWPDVGGLDHSSEERGRAGGLRELQEEDLTPLLWFRGEPWDGTREQAQSLLSPGERRGRGRSREEEEEEKEGEEDGEGGEAGRRGARSRP
jgi:hypothetical protein